jgi:hypothetical protein
MDVSLNRDQLFEIVQAIRQWPWIRYLPGNASAQDYASEPTLPQPSSKGVQILIWEKMAKTAKIRRG